MVNLVFKIILSGMFLLFLSSDTQLFSNNKETYILIPMDNIQKEHLRAYGVVYLGLSKKYKGEWLLNYRGGSFLLPNKEILIDRASSLDVSYKIINKKELLSIYKTIENNNMSRIELINLPKIAVYTPPDKEPWDDAVTLVLTYAKIPFDKIWDSDIIKGVLKSKKYDWLHLHHEDFTGQYGKFFSSYERYPFKFQWYLKMVLTAQKEAKKHHFKTVQMYKYFIAKSIKDFIRRGGFLFAMCTATDTLDIALSAEGIDIIAKEIDGTPIDDDIQAKLDYSKTLAFTKYTIYTDPRRYEFSNIDIDVVKEDLISKPDFFELFRFSAQVDTIPCMLNQNHVRVVKGFLGQTTGFNHKYIKSKISILAKTPNTDRIKYIHGNFGKGTFTFYGGHDPESYIHELDDPPTNLSKYPSSPGYRLILNNIFLPSVNKKLFKRKT